jgi:polyferredoxin
MSEGFYVVGAMAAIGNSIGRMVCGWACPLGLFFAKKQIDQATRNVICWNN